MSEETKQIVVVFGLGIPIAALATYVHFRVLRYLKERRGVDRR